MGSLLLALALSAPRSAAQPPRRASLEQIESLARRTLPTGPEALSEAARFEGGRLPALAVETSTVPVWDRPMSLADKARLFEERTRREHRPWLGLVLSKIHKPDGSWIYTAYGDAAIFTGTYVVSQALRRSVTDEAEALGAMEESLWGLHHLHAATGLPGVIAGGLVPKAHAEQEGFAGSEKWHAGTGDYAGWMWQENLSYDQYDGWVFAIASGLPLVRDPKLRGALLSDLRAVGRHMIRNNLQIVGIKERIGFHPNYAYQDRWPGILKKLPIPPVRGGNAMHGLHLMRAIASLTGDAEFQRFYEDEMVLNHELDLKLRKFGPHFPPQFLRASKAALSSLARLYYGPGVQMRPEAMVSDLSMNLSHMALYDLARMEEEPDLRSVYREVLDKTHAEVEDHGNSYWNFLYASQFKDDPASAERVARAAREGVDTLRRFPTRPIFGKVVNSDDPAIPKYKGPPDKIHKRMQNWRWYSEKPLPIERQALHATFAWQSNPYEMDGGNDAKQGSGAAYLVAYWLGRANGFIRPED